MLRNMQLEEGDILRCRAYKSGQGKIYDFLFRHVENAQSQIEQVVGRERELAEVQRPHVSQHFPLPNNVIVFEFVMGFITQYKSGFSIL